MRTCKEWADLIPDYPKGQMEPAMVRDLDHHLADCPRCLDVLAEELIQAYREAADHLAPRAFPTTGAVAALR